MTETTWDPDRYLTYAGERGRPFLDLLAPVRADAPRSVVDLGCGPGNLTALLEQRWGATAHLAGVDASAEMIARAERDHPGIDWSVEDLRDYLSSAVPVDVLISNATLQWIPGHLELMPALVHAVRPGGWLAFQVPGNFAEPSHTLRAELAARAPYAEHVGDVEQPASHDAATYLRALQGLGCTVDAWETTYLHVLDAERYGPDPVFTWVSGTGARPTLQALEPAGLRERFEAEFKQSLRQAYPDDGHGVVLPFRRIFVVARIGGAA